MNSLIIKAKKAFLDTAKIKVKGGSGGPGLPQYGGIGGKGGDVYIQGSSRVTNLESIYKMCPNGYFEAQKGKPSIRTRLLGENGRDMIIKVPLGVTVEDLDKQFIGEINKPREKVIVALGGRGGDKFNDNQGFKGQERVIRLDMKMISDAVLVGFPNAGKSTLLRAISNAKPKVASYPFTTLKPNLGIVNYPDYRTISVADLPGLVEGAHKNIGLGHEFLKHIVRTKLLVFLIDINDADLGPLYARRTPLETLCILLKEIELFDDTLLQKPAILALSKMDSCDDANDRYSQFEEELKAIQKNPNSLDRLEEPLRPQNMISFSQILPLSSVSNLNIKMFKNCIREVIDEYAESIKPKQDRISSYKDLQSLENNRMIQ